MNKRKIFLAAFVCSFFIYFSAQDASLAQNMTIETIPPEVDESGQTTEERIDQIVITLRILAAVVLVGTLGYWWHTKPKKSSNHKTENTETNETESKNTLVDSVSDPWSSAEDDEKITDS